MSFKRVICSICKQEVNKAQTYHVGGINRACKSHEGVTAKKDELQKKEADNKLKQIAEAERRRAERFPKFEAGDFEPGKLRCSVCHNSGLRSDSFFTRVLLEQSKAEQIYGPFSPLDFKHPGNQIKIGERCVFVVERAKLTPVLRFLNRDFKQILDLIGAVGVCANCCKKHGIDPLPKIEFEELLKFSAIYETFAKPIVDEIARKEMGTKN